MRCLDVLVKMEGDVDKLMIDEKQAIETVAKAMLDDVRGFDWANAPEADILEFMQYTYLAICDELSEIYERDCPF